MILIAKVNYRGAGGNAKGEPRTTNRPELTPVGEVGYNIGNAATGGSRWVPNAHTMNAHLRESSATNTATGYYAEDATNPSFFIEGAVRMTGGQTVLSFIVLAERTDASGAAVRGQVRGHEFFDAMWAHFVAAGMVIDVIQADWTSAPLSATVTFTTNLDAFNKAVLVHPTLEMAALNGTVTGKYAKGKGHTEVLIVRALPPNASGPYSDVVVQFRKTGISKSQGLP